MRALAVGPISVRKISEKENISIYDITIQEKDAFKQQNGEYAGKYNRTFIPAKFFADTPQKKQFVEETLTKIAENKTPVSASLIFRNNYHEKDGQPVYDNEFVIDNIVPFL